MSKIEMICSDFSYALVGKIKELTLLSLDQMRKLRGQMSWLVSLSDFLSSFEMGAGFGETTNLKQERLLYISSGNLHLFF